uniref:Pep_M12B_propep domain-containing protein n=1 Tax=Anopheles albimanus TaxID=7167 RepID=A0A182FRX9_ANOAL
MNEKRGAESNASMPNRSKRGAAGVLRTNRTEYWIEPSKNHQPGPNGEHPHVLFKRADVKETPIKVEIEQSAATAEHE